jgi:hypothetical protein
LSDEERKPSMTDYMAAAALAYGIIYFWIKLMMVAETPSLLTYPIYYLAGLVPSYLVCRRIDSAYLAVGIKVALVAWAFIAVMLLAFVEEPSLAFFGMLLICLVLGGATASYLALRQSLQPRSLGDDFEGPAS